MSIISNRFHSCAGFPPGRRPRIGALLVLLLAPLGVSAQDMDGDGWAVADNDCCDVASALCPHPRFVNPGALEIVGNLVDDDCDAATPDDTPAASCSAERDVTDVTAQQIAEAMDLCQVTTSSPPLAMRKWGLINANLLNADGSVPTATALWEMQNRQAVVLISYGTGGISPTRGATMAGLSTGIMRIIGESFYVFPNPGTDFDRPGSAPASFLAAHGGFLPDGNLCGTTCHLDPFNNGGDSINTRLTLRAPTNAVALGYRFRHFTADFPNYLCTDFNDLHLALLSGAHPDLPADRNIAANPDGSRCSSGDTVYRLCTPGQTPSFPCITCDLGTGALAGTGFPAGTEWFTARGPVMPGETLTLDLMVFDIRDRTFDMNVLLDDFHWLPEIVFGGPLTASFE